MWGKNRLKRSCLPRGSACVAADGPRTPSGVRRGLECWTRSGSLPPFHPLNAAHSKGVRAIRAAFLPLPSVMKPCARSYSHSSKKAWGAGTRRPSHYAVASPEIHMPRVRSASEGVCRFPPWALKGRIFRHDVYKNLRLAKKWK